MSQLITDYQPTRELLRDRVILVTGAGDGIGRCAAKAFAAHGATVILLGRTTRKLESLYDEIEDNHWPQAAIYPMNLEGASQKNYEDLADTLGREFGHLNGLLHNAATLGTLTPLEHYNVQEWYRVLQVNLNARFLLTRACLRLLKTAQDASVVFTSADVGRHARAYWGAYAVSNFGSEALTQLLADECEVNTGIRVNSVDPGAVLTQMRRAAYPAEDPRTLPQPEVVLPTYLYLMGPDSRGVSGQAFDVQPK